jgi:hypothetical protein
MKNNNHKLELNKKELLHLPKKVICNWLFFIASIYFGCCHFDMLNYWHLFMLIVKQFQFIHNMCYIFATYYKLELYGVIQAKY